MCQTRFTPDSASTCSSASATSTAHSCTRPQSSGAIFKMIIGVAIGGIASGGLADLYMHHYEKRYVYEHLDSAFVRLLVANQIVVRRYRDDLLVSNCSLFADICEYVYPPDLRFTTGAAEGQQCTFLDMRLTIRNGHLDSEIFNKWETVTFFQPIVFPNICSNAQLQQAHKCLYSDILRVYTICTHENQFMTHALRRIMPVVEKGYDVSILVKVCRKLVDSERKYAQHYANGLGERLTRRLLSAVAGWKRKR